MSDTPLTDAHVRQLADGLAHPHWVAFARGLERENAALRADKERLEWLLTANGGELAYRTLYKNFVLTRAAIDAARKGQP